MSCGRIVCEECGGRHEGILRCRECLAVELAVPERIPRARRMAAFAARFAAAGLALATLILAFRELIRLAAFWGA